MLKLLAVIAIVLAVVANAQVVRNGKPQHDPARDESAHPPACVGCIEIQPGAAEKKSDTESKPYQWSEFYAPANVINGLLAIAAIFAGAMALKNVIAIKEQTKETARAAKATEDAVLAAETSYKLARDTSERELRAYLTVSNARLFLYEDGSVEPRLTITNSGQTPAYELWGIQSLSFDGHRPKTNLGPSDEFLPRYGAVGKTYRLTGEKRQLATSKKQFMGYLTSGEMVINLTGWYWYKDIFDKIWPLKFQLMIGGGMISLAKNSKYEWLVFFDDPLVGYPGDDTRQNPN